MKSQPSAERTQYPRLARVSKLSVLVLVLWLSLAGGVVMLFEDPTMGIALFLLAVVVVAGFRAEPIRRLFEAESRSRSLPARMLSAHLLILLLSAVPATVYLDELPLNMMDPGSQRVFIYAGITVILAAGALIASLIALRRDRAERRPR